MLLFTKESLKAVSNVAGLRSDLTVRRNELLTHETTWMNCKIIMLTGRSWQKHGVYNSMYIKLKKLQTSRHSNRKVVQQLPGRESGRQARPRGCGETFGSDGHFLPWSRWWFHRCVWTYVKSSWILYLKYMPFILSQLFNNNKRLVCMLKKKKQKTNKPKKPQWFK